MFRRAGLRGMVLAGCLGFAIHGAVAASGEAPSDRLQRGSMVSGPSLFAIQSLRGYVEVAPLQAAASGSWMEADDFWQRRWQSDRETITRLGLDAMRNGPVLSLRLDGERLIRFVDEVGSCTGFFTCISHLLHDYIADHGYYVLSVGHGEGGWAYLIDRRSGEVSAIAAPPVLSQDRRLALAWYPSLMEGPRLDVIHFTEAGVEIEAAIVEGSCWPRIGMADSNWKPFRIDADSIAWTRSVGDAEEMQNGVVLKRFDGQWQVVCEQ